MEGKDADVTCYEVPWNLDLIESNEDISYYFKLGGRNFDGWKRL